MTNAGQGYVSFHVSTGALPGSRRLSALRDLFDRAIQLEVDAAPDQAIEIEMHVAPGLRRARMLSPFTARTTRPASMLADNEDTVCLIMKTGGHLALDQGRRNSVPHTGDGVLLVYREPAVLKFVEATYVSVRVPSEAIAMGAADVGAAAALCVPRDTEALTLLRAYLMALPDRIADPRLGRLSSAHVYDLIALAIGAADEGRAIAGRTSVRAARLEALKSDLVANPALRLERLAARQRVSPRYVQLLFEESGTTYSAFALECRLDAARAMLASPRYASWSVTSIALEAGFGDLSYFNRRFKRRYGMTPTELRQESCRAPSGQGH